MLVECWLISLKKQQDYTRNSLEEEREESLMVPYHQCELYWDLGAFLACLSLGYSFSIAIVLLCYPSKHTFLHSLLGANQLGAFSHVVTRTADLPQVEVGACAFSEKGTVKVKSLLSEAAQGQ